MTSTRSRRATVILVMLLAGPAPDAAAGPRSLRDIFDRAVPFAEGRPTFLLFANRSNKDSVDEPMGRLTFELRDLNPVVVIRVDLSDVPSFFRGYARDRLRESHKAGIERFVRQCREAAEPPPGDADRGLYFVADWEGQGQRELDLPPSYRGAFAIAYDAKGREVGRGPFPKAAESLEKSLRAAIELPPRPRRGGGP